MKTGINFNCFQSGESYLALAREAKAAGFDLIEVATRMDGELNLFSHERDFLRFREALSDIGIGMRSTNSGIFGKHPLTAKDPAARKEAMELVRRQLHAAAALGCDTTLVTIGAVTPDMDYESAYAFALETLTALADEAAACGVSIGVENVWNKFLLSPLEMRALLDQIASDFVGAYFDIGNVVLCGYPEQWIKILGERIKKVHFKDFRRDVGTLAGFTRLMTGDVDYHAVIKALRGIGYDDAAVTEINHTMPARTVRETMEEAAADLRAAINA